MNRRQRKKYIRQGCACIHYELYYSFNCYDIDAKCKAHHPNNVYYNDVSKPDTCLNCKHFTIRHL